MKDKLKINYPWESELESKSGFVDTQHPRDSKGKFAPKAGGGAGEDKFKGVSSVKLLMSRNEKNAKEVDAELDRRNSQSASKGKRKGKGPMTEKEYEQEAEKVRARELPPHLRGRGRRGIRGRAASRVCGGVEPHPQPHRRTGREVGGVDR